MRSSRSVLRRATAIIALTAATFAAAPAAHALPLGRCVGAQGQTIICLDEDPS